MKTAPTLLTSKEAAEILGLSVRSLYTVATSGELPRIRVGAKAVRYDLDDVIRYVERRKTRARRRSQ